mmetsp:Transcript_2583/g.3509  ORF Transcript_2583/g.3509 Transcript_2583/m.3509 type:complete len:275 (-) Transcript_2583:126-950(-)
MMNAVVVVVTVSIAFLSPKLCSAYSFALIVQSQRVPTQLQSIFNRRTHHISTSGALSATEVDQERSGLEENDDYMSYKAIAQSYLSSKFQDCGASGDNCKIARDLEEVKQLLRTVLPPVTKEELEAEVNLVASKIGGKPEDDISESEYLAAVFDNTYWNEAGPFVVKELIFLDCLHQYYYGGEGSRWLSNEDYDELKEQLTWEGSVATTLSSKEAHFITAVASSRRGEPIINDADYEVLKKELWAQDSWVVKRQQDPLERLGLKTFMGYLHRSL